MLTVALMLCGVLVSNAQSKDASQHLPDSPTPAERTIEGLNYLGGDAAMPPFSDSVIDVDSAFRQVLFRQGLAFRVITGPEYTQNMLDAPVSADEQVYVCQRAFESSFVQPILSSDLRQLHLRRAQLYMGGVWNWASWNPAGPKSLQLWALYFYKEIGNDRLEVKAGSRLSARSRPEVPGIARLGIPRASGLGIFRALAAHVSRDFPAQRANISHRDDHGPDRRTPRRFRLDDCCDDSACFKRSRNRARIASDAASSRPGQGPGHSSELSVVHPACLCMASDRRLNECLGRNRRPTRRHLGRVPPRADCGLCCHNGVRHRPAHFAAFCRHLLDLQQATDVYESHASADRMHASRLV